MATIHKIVIRAGRKVREPLFGAHAYHWSVKEIEIPFGKNEAIKTGKKAYAEALVKAESLKAMASEVSIWVMRGYSGTGEYLKNSEEFFDLTWKDLEAQV